MSKVKTKLSKMCFSALSKILSLQALTKGSLIVECGRMLRHFGYRIKVMNTINFAKSMHYNPLAYARHEVA